MEELEQIVERLELENDKRAASDPLTKTALSIVEEFLKTHRVMCYGGTAINNLLPREDQFYDPNVDVPDYDFFSQTPQEHAMILANKLAAAGIKSIEVKPGIHVGTFKVFAEYEGVADITELEESIFQRLWDENVVKTGIHYVPPNFLRMSMYLELSRPLGDVSRWLKVYARLQLLNKHHPILCKADVKTSRSELTHEMKREIVRILKNQPVVLLGITAAEIHLKTNWTTPVVMLADKDTIEKLTKGKKVDIDEGSEILPPRYNIIEKDGSSHLRFYETTACHSYHNAGGIRVASIPTILQFFFAYLYSNAKSENVENTLCIAQRLADLAAYKPRRRFELLTPIDCIGKQETLMDMRRHKSELYEKLSKDRTSPEFIRYFFTYNPHTSKTERQTARERLRKTRKARSGKTL
jgi:hypothetical protein